MSDSTKEKEKMQKEFESEARRQIHIAFLLDEIADAQGIKAEEADRRLSEQFGPKAVKGFGLEGDPLAVVAAGAVLHYLEQSQYTHTGHLTGITRWREDSHLWMDAFTVRNPDAYERLLMDVVRGNQALFMRRDEVEEAWGWIDPVLDAWSASSELPKQSTAGTWGPSSAVALIERDGRTWYEDQDID